MATQLDKFWLKTELFVPDEDLKYKTMVLMNNVFDDYFNFVINFEDIDNFPSSFENIFLSENYYDYLRLVKNELKIVLKGVTKTEQLTGVFTGLIGHEMSFGFKKDNRLNLSYEKKEFIMLHTLKLMDIAYYEEFKTEIPLPDDYKDWLAESHYHWESYVRDLD